MIRTARLISFRSCLRDIALGFGLMLQAGIAADVARAAAFVALVAIANHPQANALRPVIEALIAWTARDQNLP